MSVVFNSLGADEHTHTHTHTDTDFADKNNQACQRLAHAWFKT